MPDAAQQFLDKQLSKNRFTAKQQARLDASGGPSVVGSGAGVIPAGEAYAKYGKMPGSDSSTETSNSSSTTSGGGGVKSATSTWDGKNYSQGAFNADDLKKHFGLEDGSDVGSGYNSDAGATDGDQTKDNDLLGAGYLSNKNYDKLKSDSKVKEAYAAINGQEAADKKFKDGSISINTLDGLFDKLTARANTDEAPAPEPEKERTPIEYSPEVSQAQARVRAYEDNVMSGKTSDDIFSGTNNPNNTSDQYQLDLDKGQDGIGSAYSAQPKSNEATQSFLDSKKTDYKKAYNFQPKTSSAYGAN